jgi:hypothetical protein
MAVPLNDGKKKRHDARKNPRSAELWRERKRAANAARPKQTRVEPYMMVVGSVERECKWSREAE